MITENRSWSFFLDHVNNFACIDNAFPPSDLDQIIEYCKAYGLEDAKIENEELNNDVRKNKSVFIGPTELKGLYRRLTDICVTLNNEYFKFDVFGFMEGLQFTEYNAPDNHYSDHIDKLYAGVVRKLTMVLQLTDPDEYEGGDLELILGAGVDTVKVKRTRGSLILFPSYVLHRVTPITKGKRHSLVGWVTGKPFV